MYLLIGAFVLLATLMFLVASPLVISAFAETPDVANNVPGVPVPTSPVAGQVGPGDIDDVYAITLAEGDLITINPVAVTASAFLYPVGTTNVDTDPPLDWALGGGTFSYLVPAGGAGTYYIDIYAGSAGESDSYTFSYFVESGSGAPPSTEPTSGSSVTVSAVVEAYDEILTFAVQAGSAPTSGTVTDTSIDFGTLVANVPKTGSHNLVVTTNAPNGFFVIASEDHPLRNATGQVVPDVIGDTGSITESQDGLWEQPTTVGFGYRYGGEYNYRQFADASSDETGDPVAAYGAPCENRISEMKYKINISGAQAPGTYTNTISYLATGNF